MSDNDEIFFARLNEMDKWAAEHEGRTEAWWEAQRQLNDKEEVRMTALEAQANATEHRLETHKVACEAKDKRIVAMEEKIDLISVATDKYQKEWTFAKGGYAAISVVIAAVCSVGGLIIALISLFSK